MARKSIEGIRENRKKEHGKLSAEERKHIPKEDFAVKSKAPGSGSYPIEDRSHARNALARSSGKPVEAEVRRAVEKKYPGMGKKHGKKEKD